MNMRKAQPRGTRTKKEAVNYYLNKVVELQNFDFYHLKKYYEMFASKQGTRSITKDLSPFSQIFDEKMKLKFETMKMHAKIHALGPLKT